MPQDSQAVLVRLGAAFLSEVSVQLVVTSPSLLSVGVSTKMYRAVRNLFVAVVRGVDRTRAW